MQAYHDKKKAKIRKIVFATGNPGKILEIKQILAGLPIQILSAKEAGVNGEAVEDGETFAENAAKKAEFVGLQTNEWTMADDSGICVRALKGAPGVHSARWAGEGVTGHKLADKLLREMRGVPDSRRRAWFETVAVLRSPQGHSWTFIGKVYGWITHEKIGEAPPSLPYDPVFIPEGYIKTFAEMGLEKNHISHRGQAFKKLCQFLKNR